MLKLPGLAGIRIGIQSAFLEMRTHAIRSLLSVIGVALSMAAATSMVCLLRGTNLYLERMVQEFGSAGTIRSVAKAPGSEAERVLYARSRGLRYADADSINSGFPGTLRAFKSVDGNLPVEFRSNVKRIRTRGVDRPTLEREEKVRVQEGRFFSEEEYNRGERVCVIGWKLEQEGRQILRNPRSSLVGSRLRVGGLEFEVIGVFTKTYREDEGPGYMLYMPVGTMRKDFSGVNPALGEMGFRMAAPDSQAAMIKALTHRFLELHKGAADVSFSGLDGLSDFLAMMGNLKITFILIIAVALGIGGTNIMNLMLSTLSERITEIGVRKSIGASRWGIFNQFLVESLVISLLGGIMGLALGLAPLLFSDAIEAAMEGIRPSADGGAFAAVFVLSICMGLFSGIYPALKASRMDPVEALRHI